MSASRRNGKMSAKAFISLHQYSETAKSCSRTPVGAKLQPAIFNYFRALHSQMRYSSQAQKTPLKSSSTSFTLLARPGEKAWIYSSITATKSAKKRI